MLKRVLIADDHALIREGLEAVLGRDPNLEIVGEAATGLQAVELAARLAPDVVIMDLAMPEMNGVEATRLIRERNPQQLVVILSGHASAALVDQALAAGASGFVLKKQVFRELRKAIEEVVAGRRYVCPYPAASGEPGRAGRQEAGGLLSARERQVLQLLAEGLTAAEAAGRLSIAVTTVETHRRNIMRKLDLHNLAELTRYAIREGLTDIYT